MKCKILKCNQDAIIGKASVQDLCEYHDTEFIQQDRFNRVSDFISAHNVAALPYTVYAFDQHFETFVQGITAPDFLRSLFKIENNVFKPLLEELRRHNAYYVCQIEQLKAKNISLEKDMDDLKNRIKALEQ